MDFNSTVKGSLLEGFYPKGWDMEKIDKCCEKGVAREDFWNKDFAPVSCESIYEFDTLMGHEIALQIKNARDNGEKIAFILPVGPMGMYKWAVYFLKAWNVSCSHVYTFNMDEWKKQTHRIGAKLHPLTIEQNAITSFKSRTTLVPCRANTIGPGLILQADYAIGGCDGALSRGMQWQGMSFLTTLHYGPDMWITSSFIPTMPGKLFYLKELEGPLNAECN